MISTAVSVPTSAVPTSAATSAPNRLPPEHLPEEGLYRTQNEPNPTNYRTSNHPSPFEQIVSRPSAKGAISVHCKKVIRSLPDGTFDEPRWKGKLPADAFWNRTFGMYFKTLANQMIVRWDDLDHLTLPTISVRARLGGVRLTLTVEISKIDILASTLVDQGWLLKNAIGEVFGDDDKRFGVPDVFAGGEDKRFGVSDVFAGDDISTQPTPNCFSLGSPPNGQPNGQPMGALAPCDQSDPSNGGLSPMSEMCLDIANISFDDVGAFQHPPMVPIPSLSQTPPWSQNRSRPPDRFKCCCAMQFFVFKFGTNKNNRTCDHLKRKIVGDQRWCQMCFDEVDESEIPKLLFVCETPNCNNMVCRDCYDQVMRKTTECPYCRTVR